MTRALTLPSANRLRVMALDALIWCLLGVLIAASFANANAIGGLYPKISLRYDRPISGQAAYAARLYSIEQGDEDAFWPTFWREYTATLESDFMSVTADCIAYSGDITLVWPAEILCGAAPGVTDGSGCAVSEKLAWELWGNIDVVGRIIEVDGEERVVRAVFKGETELALLPYSDDDSSQNWSAAELSGGPSDATREDILSYAAASGLGRPDSILTGAGPSFLAFALAALPVAILAGYWIALIIGSIRKRPAARRLVTFILLIGFALLLPNILAAAPAWLIPTRWSDFSFWSSLAEQMADSLREFLGATPRQRDIEGQMRLLAHIGAAFLSACCAIIICHRSHIFRQTLRFDDNSI